MDEREIKLECLRLAVEAAKYPDNPKDLTGIANAAEQFYNAVVKNSTSGGNRTLGLPDRDKAKAPR
jgi:hypothetical protein